MNKLLFEYITFVNKFKSNHNIMIIDLDMIILSVTNHNFFERYYVGFKEGVNLFDCLKHLPLIDRKSKLYESLIESKKVQGYFITQSINENNEHLIDRVYLSPILDNDQELIGIELECVAMEGLPLVNIIESDQDYQLYLPLLTKREHEIAVLKYVGKTDFEISTILSANGSKVSEKTISNIIRNQLYPKLGVYNKHDLIKKIYNISVDKFIPRSLIATNQLIVFSSLDFTTSKVNTTAD